MRLRQRLVTLLLLITVTLGFALHYTQIVAASTCTPSPYSGAPKIGCGYFNNKTYIGVSGGTGNKVIRHGIPDSVNSKANFIAFIKDLYNTPSNYTKWYGSDGYGSNASDIAYDEANNKWGAAYIIQTMRGNNNGSGWDHSFPTSSDITNWETLINQSGVTYSNLEAYTDPNDINTRIDPSDSNKYDIYQFSEGGTFDSIVFYAKVNGVNVKQYVVKRACGNPLGNLPGIPLLNYSLTPRLSLASSSTIDLGQTVYLDRYVDNSGPAASNSTTWELDRSINGGSYTKIDSGSQQFNASPATTNLGRYGDSDTNKNLGDKLCYILIVTPHSSTDNSTYPSRPPVCVTIVKHPKVQILGGDLILGGSAYGYLSPVGGKTYGSWVEYAIYAGGTINNVASGSTFNNGMASATTCSFSKLSFTYGVTSGNGSTCATIGGYNYNHLPNVPGSFPVNSSTPVLNGTVDLASKSSGVYTTNSDIDIINNGQIQSGKWIVINTSHNVNIKKDIQYSNGPFTNINQIPQVVIIASNITIFDSSANKVTNVDSWLIANNLYTCDIAGDTASKCNDPLNVNGPVIATKLYLRRTGGSSASAPGDPAERFNLRADAYLWAYARSSSSGKVTTVDSTELPPRY